MSLCRLYHGASLYCRWFALLHASTTRFKLPLLTKLGAYAELLWALQVGVGNSRLQLDMILDDYASVTSIDYSDIVIAQLQKVHALHPELQYAVADARQVAVSGTNIIR